MLSIAVSSKEKQILVKKNPDTMANKSRAKNSELWAI